MNHVSIFEKKWLDLVFENKNKAYGAYRLRLENPRTTMLALFLGLLLLASVASIGVLAVRLSGDALQIAPIIGDTVEVTEVNLSQPPKQPETQAAPPVVKPAEPIENTQQLTNPVVVPPDLATPVNLTNKPTPPDTPPGTGTPGQNPSPGTNGTPGATTPGTGTVPSDKPVPPAILDSQPQYPGGIEKFYQYVGDNFDKPDVDDISKLSVIVLFVIEKDGSISDVRVARDPGYGMAKEALRVLKSLKIKWKPGYKDGQPVRTAYTLPITVNIQ